ncbi:MAG: hypothetical protein ACR2LQ_12150 [Acidimicrobiales bacterium]
MSEQLDTGGGAGARLDARLASLETRLQMAETAMHVEVERVHLAAEQIDSFVLDMRGTIGDARNMADLVNNVGDRLSELTSIDRNVAAVTATVTHELGSFGDRLEELAAGLERVDKRVADAVDAATEPSAVADPRAEVASLLSPLEARLDVLAGSLRALHERPQLGEGALGAIVERLDRLGESRAGTRQVEAGATGQALAPVIDRLAVVLDGLTSVSTNIEHLATAVGSLHLEGASGSPRTEIAAKLDQLSSTVSELRSNRPDITSSLQALAGLVESARVTSSEGQQRLDVLSARIAATETRFVDVLAGIAVVVDQLGASAGATRPLRSPSRASGVHQAGAGESPGAGAGLVASVAGALARLEDRIDTEFDSVGRQIDALGTLVHHTIEAVDRIESQIVGAQPGVGARTAASNTVDLLRETSRQRAARRTAPPELNR